VAKTLGPNKQVLSKSIIMQIQNYSTARRFSIFTAIIGLLIAITGFLVILAWKNDIDFLRTFGLGSIPIKANAGACFLLSGIALVLLQIPRPLSITLSRLFAVGIIFIGILSILEIVFSINFGIDEILFRKVFLSGLLNGPTRMALNTAICQVLTATILIFLSFRPSRLSFLLEFCFVLTISICIFGLIEFTLSLSQFSELSGYKNMAVIASILFLFMCTGIYLTFLSKTDIKITIDHKFFAGIIFTSTLVIFVSLLSSTSYRSLLQANTRTIHTQDIKNYLNLLFSDVLDIETGTQAYLVSNDKEYLSSLGKAKEDLKISMLQLKTLLRDNEKQVNRLDSLNRLILERVEHAELLISVISTEGKNAGVVLFQSNKGMILTDKIRILILKMKDDENQVLKERNQTEINHSKKTQTIVYLNLIIELVLLAFIFIVIRRNISQRNKAILKFQGLNEDLEMRVIERTEKLARSEERFRSTLENIQEGCQIIGHNWNYLFINEAAEKHNRRASGELIGKKYTEMWPGIQDTEVFRRLKDCMTTRVSDIMENEFVFPDGSRGWFDLRIQPVPEGIFILSTDITSRKQSENFDILANEILEHLNRHVDSELMISSIIASIKSKTGFEAIAIRLKDGEDFPYYKTIGFDEKFVETERYLCSSDRNGNIIHDRNGDPILNCMCGNILCGRVDSSKSFFTDGGSFRSNNTTLLLASTTPQERLARTRNRCNSAGYESVALVPLRSGKEIVGLLQMNDHRTNIFSEDIIPFFERLGASIGIALMRNKAENEINKLNEELENRVVVRTGQLLESNKELESFAYSVSHDLRAPLRHVIGFSEKLDSILKERNDSEINRLTGIIKNAATRMSRLIDELLVYSRLGRTELKTVLLALNPVIDEVIRESADLTSDRNITWKIKKLPDVNVDKTLIKLVFQNLVGNSIKFTRKKTNTVIEIDFEENSKEYTFFIRDNGAGFNMEYANKLFGVFQRLHTLEEFEGTGIGLATVQRIIKRHGGTVRAEGVENEGATFFFTIPR
jgi:PAS domain S-box-containing protein